MTIDRNTKVDVTNRKSCYTGYTIEDYNLQGGNLTRNFAPGETKTVTVSELQSLLSTEGGRVCFRDYLVIKDKEILDFLNNGNEMEPEYFYGDEDIKNIILNGSLDEFEDCLNFAPSGVVDRVKQLALELEMPDARKRKILFDKTGYNLDNNLIINRAMETDEEVDNTVSKNEKPQRKATGTKTRKANTPNPEYQPPQYEVIG